MCVSRQGHVEIPSGQRQSCVISVPEYACIHLLYEILGQIASI
jgi:hypothetical protein